MRDFETNTYLKKSHKVKLVVKPHKKLCKVTFSDDS